MSRRQLLRLPHQHVIQVVTASDSSVATGTTTTPSDDSIPQITEGNEFITVSITPKFSNSTLIITANVILSSSINGSTTTALHQDATAGALAAVGDSPGAANAFAPITLIHIMTSATIVSTIFRIRAGGSGASTITFNGISGAQRFNGVSASTLQVVEVEP